MALAAVACGSSGGGSGSKGTGGAGGSGGETGGASASAGSTAKGGAANGGAAAKGGAAAGGESGATAESGAAGETDNAAGAGNAASGGASSAGGAGGASGGISSAAGTAGSAGAQGGAPPVPGNDLCANATLIQFGTTTTADISATTLGAKHDIDPPCVSGAGADVFYEFDVSKRVFVYADTFGASWNTVLYLLSNDCTPITTPTTPGDAVCNGTACGGSQSQIVALLDAGRYRLGLSGRGGAAGAATIHFQFTLAGSGSSAELAAGSSTPSGTTTGSSGNMQGLSSDCIAAGPENAYWWTSCPNDPGGAFSASTCGGASWETVLALEIPASTPYKCSLDSCSLQASINATIPAGAGLRVLAVDGQDGTDKGAYTMTVSRP